MHLKCILSALETNLCVNGSCFTWLIVLSRRGSFKTSKCRGAHWSKDETLLESALIQSKRRKIITEVSIILSRNILKFVWPLFLEKNLRALQVHLKCTSTQVHLKATLGSSVKPPNYSFQFDADNKSRCSSAMTAMPYIENNISGKNQSRPKRGSQFCHVQKISEDERSKAKWTAQQSRNC